jgi:hypothetical protein
LRRIPRYFHANCPKWAHYVLKSDIFGGRELGTDTAYMLGMTLKQATKKADALTLHGLAVVVEVADPAHGHGMGDNRFDAVPLSVFERDQNGGRYMTLVEIRRQNDEN